jgi:hypothetical protein
MSKRVSSGNQIDGFISPAEAEKALYTLCATYGFCLPPLWRSRLLNNPPRSVTKFVDTVFRAEGLNPVTADSKMYKEMIEVVRQAFERSAQAAASGTV